MWFKSVKERLFTSIATSFSSAGKSFSSVVATTKKLVDFRPTIKHKQQMREKDDWNFARKFNPHLNTNQLVPRENIVRTKNNLKKRYQYLFQMDIEFERGLKRIENIYSVLSDNKLTIEQAKTQLLKQVLNNENNYGATILSIGDIKFQAERTEVWG